MGIKPGEVTTRKLLEKEFEGGIRPGKNVRQGGVLICNTTNSILLFSDPKEGEKYGYYDGWITEEGDLDPVFEYTGHGKKDQEFTLGNKAIREHVGMKRTLHVFKTVGRAKKWPHLAQEAGPSMEAHRYVGEFFLDEEAPYVVRQQPNDKGEVRNVIVFRLRPVPERYERRIEDEIPQATKTTVDTTAPSSAVASLVEAELSHILETQRSATRRTVVRRRESQLVVDYQEYLESYKHEVGRWSITPKGVPSPLATDLFDKTAGVLYEAKGTCSRESIRMAIGQLMDYRRFVDPKPRLAVLLPHEPHHDLCELLESLKIELVYRHEKSFVGPPAHEAATGAKP